jgi:predicted restriction endonuclease
MNTRKKWTRDELIVVFNLYCSIPFGQMHQRNPVVLEMAQKLDRTPGSVAMKLVNFASLDPAETERGIKGLSGVSSADRQVWNEFHQDWSRLALESEQILRKAAKTLTAVRKELVEPYDEPEPAIPTGPSESTRVQAVRLLQGFFRRAVLAAYGSKCCITGNPVVELLVASHILPWKEFPQHRVDPTNGLCLAAHFDKAFDRALIAFDEEARLIVHPSLKKYLPNKALQEEFFDREGSQLRMPKRFQPNAAFLDRHRKDRFLRRKVTAASR